MAFAENLRTLRKYRNMTQKELADASGVSCSSIINYENGRRVSPPISILNKLASALRVNLLALGAEHIHVKKNGSLVLFGVPNMDDFTGQVESVAVDDWEEFIIERGEQDIMEQLREYVKLLNREGAAEAVKRVQELTEIQKYRVEPRSVLPKNIKK